MIEIGISNVYKNFGYKNVLAGVNCEIMTGERVGIVGRNGAGKSTLFKIISGEENPDKGAVSIRRGATIGYLEQIPSLQSKDKSVREVLMENFAEIMTLERKLHGLEDEMSSEPNTDKLDKLMNEYQECQSKFIALDGYSVSERFGRVVTGFNLEDILERPFNVLSGGQKTIVNLASTVLKQPDILLLDEPTNHLDMKTLEWFEDFLSRYSGTVIIISHDRYFLDKTTNKTIIMESGECESFLGNYSFAIKEQERLLLLEFEEFKNQQKKIAAMKSAIKRFRDWGNRGDNEKFYKKAKELEKRLEKMEVLDRPQLEKAKIPLDFSGKRSGNDVLIVEDFSIAFDDNVLFDNAEFSIFEKDKICFMGDNGTGKTTLIKAVLGEFSDYSGDFKINPSAKIGYIPQEIRFESDKMSVLEVFRYSCPSTELEARRILSKFFFYDEDVFKRASSLSGGEKVLLKLAILIQNEVNFLILDEPTNHIDVETREMLEEALLEYKGTLLFISHDRYFIRKIANRILEIKDKKIESFSGDYDSYRAYLLKHS